MKLSLLAALIPVIMLGCASHPAQVAPVQPPVNPGPVAQPVAPLVAQQVPAPPVAVPIDVPPIDLDQTPDGRLAVKGDVWELDVLNPSDWAPIDSAHEFAMMNRPKHILVLLDRSDFVKSTADFVKEQAADFKTSGFQATMQKNVMVNGRNGIMVELIGNDMTIDAWFFTTGAEAFSLGCGGTTVDFKATKPVCEELAAHFYLGRHNK